MSQTSTAVHLARRPHGFPGPETWEVRETELPPLEDGKFVVDVDFISIDPAMRGWLDDIPSYIPPVKVGAVMRAAGIGHVTESRHPDFPVGACVYGLLGVRSRKVTDGTGIQIVDTTSFAPEQYLAALGLTGLTAYFGLFELGQPQAGETVLVSGAAGGVGSMVGQLAKNAGCRVIGIAGSDEKCDWLTSELGFDAAINYKTTERLHSAIRNVAPDGVDLYFDNVGGYVLDAALISTARNARIVCCGAIADYNNPDRTGIRNYPRIITHSLTLRGFTIGDFGARLGEGRAALAELLSTGKITSRVHRIDGDVTSFPEAFEQIFDGGNTGKLVLALPTASA